MLSRFIIPALLLPLLSGCASLRFYHQAAMGQWDLLQARQPLAEALEDPNLSAQTRRNISHTPKILAFAETHMEMETGEAYRTYADLKRPYVVWNLVAAPRYSLSAREWCFPIAGCTRYKGFFDESMAAAESQQLEEAGYDVYLYGVRAYSTLGWFEDPVLSTFSDIPAAAYTDLLLHELAHRQLYVPGDTVFNESWATVVAEAGVRDYSHRQQSPLAHSQRREDPVFFEELDSALAQLRALYARADGTGIGPPGQSVDLDAEKQAIFDGFRSRYLTRSEPLAPFRRWISQPLNNARLVSVSNYYRWVPALRYQFEKLGNDYSAFYQWSETLAAMSAETRESTLEALATEATANR